MLTHIRKLVIVAGCQRSGTTLTGQILGAHPDAMLLDENDGLYPWFDSFVTQAADLPDRQQTLLRKADAKYRPEASRLHTGDSDVLALRNSISHLVLKAPNLSFRYAELASLNLPVSVVYPVRDVRAVVASMGRLHNIPFVDNQIQRMRVIDEVSHRFRHELKILQSSGVDKVCKRAIIWTIKSGLIDTFKAHRLSVYQFQYESLVANSRCVTQQLTEHTGLSNHPALLRHEAVYVGQGPGGTERSRPIDAQSLKRWQATLTTDEVQAVLGIAGDTMQSLGYHIATATP